jgi:hypothetical protein
VVRKDHARSASRLAATLDPSFRTEPALPNSRPSAVAFRVATVSSCHSRETRIKLWSRLSSA